MNTTKRSFGKALKTSTKFTKAGSGSKHYAVIRLAKIKSMSGLVNADRHNRRREGFNTANIDPNRIRLNKSLIGSPSVALDIALRAKLEGMKLRKNGNIASELILSASPDFFRQSGALEEWVKANMRIPDQTGHGFHGKLDSHSTAKWTLIPAQIGQS